MNILQKWLIVIAVWVFAIGILFNGLRDRYKLPKLYDFYSSMHPDARYDTWTGNLEVRHLRAWEIGASSWVEHLK